MGNKATEVKDGRILGTHSSPVRITQTHTNTGTWNIHKMLNVRPLVVPRLLLDHEQSEQADYMQTKAVTGVYTRQATKPPDRI